MNRISQREPGFIYVIKSGVYTKVGRSVRPEIRLQQARTWTPTPLKLIALKPFWYISYIERSLHRSLCQSWCSGEWYKFDEWNEKFFTEEFASFSDTDRDRNTARFPYWMNDTNYSEIAADPLWGESTRGNQ